MRQAGKAAGGQLLLPVRQQGLGRHNHRPGRQAAAKHACQKGAALHGLAQAHVVPCLLHTKHMLVAHKVNALCRNHL